MGGGAHCPLPLPPPGTLPQTSHLKNALSYGLEIFWQFKAGPPPLIGVPYDSHISHQNDHLSEHMTDTSVMGGWQVAGVGGTGLLRTVFGEALEGRYDFRSKLEIIPFPSRVMSVLKSLFFYVSRAFVRFAPNVWALGFWFRRWRWALFENSNPSPAFFFFCELRRPWIFFENFLSFCYLPDSYGDPQSKQSLLVMVRRKLKWTLDFRALTRSRAEKPSIVVTIGRYESCAVIRGQKEKKKTKRRQRVIVRRLNPPSSTHQRVFFFCQYIFYKDGQRANRSYCEGFSLGQWE